MIYLKNNLKILDFDPNHKYVTKPISGGKAVTCLDKSEKMEQTDVDIGDFDQKLYKINLELSFLSFIQRKNQMIPLCSHLKHFLIIFEYMRMLVLFASFPKILQIYHVNMT